MAITDSENRRSENRRVPHMGADLSSLPHTLDLSPPRIGAVLLFIASAVCIGFAWLAAGMMSSSMGVFTLALISVPVLAGVGTLLRGFSFLIRRRQATFQNDGVEVKGRGLLGSEFWYQPYTAYKGVLHREKLVRSGDHPTTIQIIELLHEDRRKCITLFTSATKEVPRAQWEAYARQLKLPALEEEELGVVGRAHDTLDKSLREQVEEGNASHAYEPGSPPPKGIDVAHDGPDAMVATIRVPRYPQWFFGIFIFLSLALMAGAVFNEENPAALFAVGALFGGLPAYALYRDRSSHRELRLDRRRVTLREPLTINRGSHDSLSFDEIESIVIRDAQANLGRELVIASDRGSMHVGVGLSREALSWLKNFLTAAIATA